MPVATNSTTPTIASHSIDLTAKPTTANTTHSTNKPMIKPACLTWIKGGYARIEGCIGW
jgi:hypothetical protein